MIGFDYKIQIYVEYAKYQLYLLFYYKEKKKQCRRNKRWSLCAINRCDGGREGKNASERERGGEGMMSQESWHC